MTPRKKRHTQLNLFGDHQAALAAASEALRTIPGHNTLGSLIADLLVYISTYKHIPFQPSEEDAPVKPLPEVRIHADWAPRSRSITLTVPANEKHLVSAAIDALDELPQRYYISELIRDAMMYVVTHHTLPWVPPERFDGPPLPLPTPPAPQATVAPVVGANTGTLELPSGQVVFWASSAAALVELAALVDAP